MKLKSETECNSGPIKAETKMSVVKADGIKGNNEKKHQLMSETLVAETRDLPDHYLREMTLMPLTMDNTMAEEEVEDKALLGDQTGLIQFPVQ